MLALTLPPQSARSGVLVFSFAGTAALLAVVRVCQPNARTRHWLGFALAAVATLVYVGNSMPGFVPTTTGLLIAALYLCGGFAMTLRICREPAPTLRAGQLIVLWCCPIVGFVILSGYYRHIDEPRVDDEYQDSFARKNEELGLVEYGGTGPILPITRMTRWARRPPIGQRRRERIAERQAQRETES